MLMREKEGGGGTYDHNNLCIQSCSHNLASSVDILIMVYIVWYSGLFHSRYLYQLSIISILLMHFYMQKSYVTLLNLSQPVLLYGIHFAYLSYNSLTSIWGAIVNLVKTFSVYVLFIIPACYMAVEIIRFCFEVIVGFFLTWSMWTISNTWVDQWTNPVKSFSNFDNFRGTYCCG